MSGSTEPKAGHWDAPAGHGDDPAMTAEEWAELMAEVAAETARLEAEATAADAALAAQQAEWQAQFAAEQEAVYPFCHYDALTKILNGPPLIVREKPKGGLLVKANQRMLTAFFAEENLLLWEPQTKAFFAYQPAGHWQAVSEEAVGEAVMELLTRLCRLAGPPQENSADICTETLRTKLVKLVKLLRGRVLAEGVFANRFPMVPAANAVLQVGDPASDELVVTARRTHAPAGRGSQPQPRHRHDPSGQGQTRPRHPDWRTRSRLARQV